MRRDLYSEVSARIIAEFEAGATPWIKPWSATAGAYTPCNAATSRAFFTARSKAQAAADYLRELALRDQQQSEAA